MKYLPIGMQTFRDIINGDYLYIDKTQHIHNLFLTGGKYFFLSRPRRFGKSLLLSTLGEIFSGNKDLFRGLWIHDKIEWGKHPIIHLDFLGKKTGSAEELNETLEFMVNQNAQTYGIELKEKGFDKQFNELIRELSKIERVVVLVDEYDKPIINNIENPDVARENRDILRTFYECIKEADEYLRFVFITGVSKFSKVSIFSGLNNLRDITISSSFSTMLGYTHQELLHYFQERIDSLASAGEGDKEALIQSIKDWYNGYSWDGLEFVYNPYSILNLFQEERFDNYWFSSGTPTFLIKAIKEKNIDLKRIENYETSKFIFDTFDIDQSNVFALLFQTGYLTLKEVKKISLTQSIYRFSYPNLEVKESLLDYLAAEYTGKIPDEMGYLVYSLQSSLEKGDLENFFKILKSIFSAIPYNIFIEEREAYYHTIIYLVLKLLGINVKAEVQTNIGRIDCVIETDNYIYVMEFKMGAANEAISQIKEKKYHAPYLSLGKQIKLVGVGFNIEKKNIDSHLIEEID